MTTDNQRAGTCLRCLREVDKGPGQNQRALQEHRTHQAARTLAMGGYIKAVAGSYGCDSGCDYAQYIVYDAHNNEVAEHGDFGEPDDDTLREWATYYGVRVGP